MFEKVFALDHQRLHAHAKALLAEAGGAMKRGRIWIIAALLASALTAAPSATARAQSNDAATASQKCYRNGVSGNYAAAVADCNQAIALNPTDPKPYNNRCVAYGAEKNYAAGIADCTKAIALDPKNAAPYDNGCYANAIIGQLQTALTDCNQALHCSPTTPMRSIAAASPT
jgi:tetratricopeptide (TPR) repeat protein